MANNNSLSYEATWWPLVPMTLTKYRNNTQLNRTQRKQIYTKAVAYTLRNETDLLYSCHANISHSLASDFRVFTNRLLSHMPFTACPLWRLQKQMTSNGLRP